MHDDDIHKLHDPMKGHTPSGGGAAKRTGYGQGGLGAGADRADGKTPNSWDAPGVKPDGRRRDASPDSKDEGSDG
jgi:hypothetical protein